MPGRSDLPTSALRSVLEQLGPLVVRHDAGEGDDDAAGEVLVTGVVIDDPELGAPLAPGSIVLGVGAGEAAAVERVLARAAAAGACAVVVKHRPGRPARPPRGAGGTGRGPALVEVAPDLTWEQLHVFLRTALLHVGDPRPGGPRTLFDVANAIAVLVDGAVVIEDEHLRVVAYSSLEHEIDDARRATILGRQIPERYVTEIREAGVTAHLEGSAEPVRFDLAGAGLLPRLVVALRTGGRTIGLLWAITDDEREATARRVLADAAPDVAVELQRHLAADASRATDRRAAARQLLDGRAVRGVADLLGAAPSGGFVALALRPVPGAPAEPDPLGRTMELATVYVDAYRIPALVAAVAGPQVEAVVGLTATTTRARAATVVDELVARTAATFGIALHGALGTVVTDVRDLPASRRDALAVLDLLAPVPDGGSASYDERRHEVALRELLQQAETGDHLTRGPVLDLVASTARSDAALVETVRAFFAAGGDVSRTAVDLAVHRNTVRYRIDRFQVVTGTDLADPVQRLVTEVQLRLSLSSPPR